MKFYSIRVVQANTKDEAIDKICPEQFDEENSLCDAALTKDELTKALR